jgi:DNA-binding NtrC family response regulator
MRAICRHLLIAEDEPILRITVADALRKEGWEVSVAADGAEALASFERQLHDVVLTDLLMPRMDGIELLRRVKATQPGTTVLIVTAHGTVDTAVEAMRLGAADFITKPFSIAQLLVRLENVCSLRQLKEQNVRLQEQLEQRFSFGKIIGKSKRMEEVFELIRLVAGSDANVLVQGESGTGKELVASAVHFNSSRRARPYIRVSCASLPESLIESELFGYEKGAFTGASERHLGRFEAADGGTLFLDEVGELPASFQVKLLRVLQERQVERLGSNKPRDIDVRIVTASQRPLEEEIAEGRFREDLLFRINTVTIRIPSLRERREDIILLARSFLQEFAKERGKAIEDFEGAVLELFDGYAWPGNVRELRNVVERAALFCKGPRIAVEDVPISVRSPSRPGGHKAEVLTLSLAVERAEAEAIRGALAETQGRRGEAADLLGVTRKTLWEKMRHLRLEGRLPRGDQTN